MPKNPDHSSKNEYPWIGYSVYSVFKSIAEQYTNKIFLQHNEESISYGELLSKVDKASSAIVSLRLELDRPIAVALPSGSSWAIIILAILKTKHFYVPIDPTYPDERNRQILSGSNASCVIGIPEEKSRYTTSFVPVDALLDLEQELVPMEDHPVTASSKACIIYTSGSTGKPKGVIQTHQSILHGAWRRSGLQNITIEDRLTWLYSPSVKGTEYCFFVALLNGASLHVRKIMDHFDDAFIDWMAEHKITIYHSVASYFRYVAGSLENSDKSLNHLRLVILGGERVLKTDLDLFFAHFKKECLLFTGLGATETGTICHFPFEELAAVEQAICPIGYPVEGITLELLDEHGKTIHSGTGILSVRSRYISPGYWNEKSDAFTLNAENGEITYVSGDLAEADARGFFYHRGRADNAVKINGYLVNLLEVESALMRHPGVQEAIVTVQEVNYQLQLHAFIEPRIKTFAIDELKSFLSNLLAKQMMPLHYTLLEHWPRLANGKINKKELRTELNSPQTGLTNSMTVEEEQILIVWKKILSTTEIPTDKTFSEAGGDSLATLQLALEFKKAGFKTINLADLIVHNTISKQAALITPQQ